MWLKLRSGFIRGLCPLRLCSLSIPTALLHVGYAAGWVLQLQPAVLYSSTAKMFAPIVCADVMAYSNEAELWPQKTSCITHEGFVFFLCMLTFSKQKELFILFFLLLLFSFFLFLKCSHWRNYNVLEHHSNIHIMRLMDSERGWQIGLSVSDVLV